MAYRTIQRLIEGGVIERGCADFCGNFQRHIKMYFPGSKDKKQGVFVKLSNDLSLLNELKAMESCRNIFCDYLVAPLLDWCEEGTCAIAYPLIEHDEFKAKDLVNPVFKNQLVQLVTLFQKQGPNKGLKKNEFSPVNTLSFANSSEKIQKASTYNNSCMAFLDANFDRISQHGDFTKNNLAITSTGRLLVFDWEDYGRVDIPFFDLATLIFSMSIDNGTTEAMSRNPAKLFDVSGSEEVINIVEKFGLDRASFVWLFPFFMMVFLDLKKSLGYGDQIVMQLTEFLENVFRSNGWISLIEGHQSQ